MNNHFNPEEQALQSELLDSAFQFFTPAQQQDFPDDAAKQNALNALWTSNLSGFTEQGLVGNPWNSENASDITNYYNPAKTEPSGVIDAPPIVWNAFPGRIGYYMPQLSTAQANQLADTGYYTSNGQQLTFGQITNPCTGATTTYGPYGPRGWQDEYCEWSVTRDTNGNITRVDFTCENPEYWNSLWLIDPNRVVELYQSTLNKPQITLDDLSLKDSKGNTVTDPTTGLPVYNPLNKWNNSPTSTSTSGGAMHLTSTPNTLQTEIGLATSATIQRTTGNTDQTTLLCCGQFGQPHRNSDPNIGQAVNQLVQAGLSVTLTNPPGLYIQTPDFTHYQTPDGTDASEFWTIVRGQESIEGLQGNFILHATFEVPASKGYTVSAIKIDEAPIQWGAQIARTINMHILGSGYPAATPAPESCVIDAPNPLAQPLQLFHSNIFDAMLNTAIPNPMGVSMTLLSNSTYVPPTVAQGSTVQMVLVCDTAEGTPSISFDQSDDISVSIEKSIPVHYAIPGNTYPSDHTAFYITIGVSSSAQLGSRTVFVTNAGQPQGEGMPALLTVVQS